MKASRYMKPPSCHKPARVNVRDTGPALGRPETHQETQHAAHFIGEIRASERGREVTKGTASPWSLSIGVQILDADPPAQGVRIES
jgi:hypothetical protein